MKPGRTAPLFLLTILLGLSTLACTGQAQVQPSGNTSTQPKAGGTLNLVNTTDPTDWDQRVNGQNADNAVGIQLAYNSLLGYKQTPSGGLPEYFDTTLTPELSDSWEVSPDAKSFTFHLRKDVKWANLPPLNGRAFTSADVKWNAEYQSSTGQFSKLPVSQNSYMYDGLVGVDTPDTYTAVFKFKDSFAPFINYMATNFSPVYAPEVLALDGGFTTNIIGTGPYQFDKTQTQKGSRWVFKKNPDYFDAAHSYPEAVQFLVLPDLATRNAAFETKQIDVLDIADVQQATDVKAASQGAKFLDYYTYARFLLLNHTSPPLNDPRIRKAISLALDRDAWVKVFNQGKAGWGVVGVGLWQDLFSQDEIRQIEPYDPVQAKKLVADAGFANGGANVKALYVAADASATAQASLLQSQLKAVGINLVLDGKEGAEVSAGRKNGNFEAHLFNEYPATDPDSVLYGRFMPGQRLNYGKVDDPKLTALVQAQRTEADPVKRKDLIKQAVRYLNENAVGIGIDRPIYTRLWQSYVKDYAVHFDWRLFSSGVWIDK